jgi:hypothetical protein
MDVTPQNNLPPESQPWGRFVEKSISLFNQSLTKVSLDIGNTLKGVNAAIKKLSDQVAKLNELTEALALQQAQLAAQQAALSAQQAALAEQQADLTDAVNSISVLASNQVTGLTDSGSSGGAIAISTGGTYGLAEVTVPAGFTRANIIAVSTITASGTSPLVSLQTNIAGNLGETIPIYSGSASDAIVTGGSSHAVSLTGLTAGSTIQAGARIAAQSGVTNAYFINSMAVTFLK